jgi:hypothetical protein
VGARRANRDDFADALLWTYARLSGEIVALPRASPESDAALVTRCCAAPVIRSKGESVCLECRVKITEADLQSLATAKADSATAWLTQLHVAATPRSSTPDRIERRIVAQIDQHLGLSVLFEAPPIYTPSQVWGQMLTAWLCSIDRRVRSSSWEATCEKVALLGNATVPRWAIKTANDVALVIEIARRECLWRFDSSPTAQRRIGKVESIESDRPSGGPISATTSPDPRPSA